MDKKLKVNFIYNFITQLITVIAPLIIAPYVSRILNVTLIGDYNYCYALVQVFALFANMGISVYGIPIISKNKDSKEDLSKCFYELMIIKTIFALISLVLYFAFIGTILKSYFGYLVIFGIYILSTYFDITWFYQGLENYKIICIRTLIVKLSSILLIFLMVKNENSMSVYILINMLSLLIPNVLLFLNLRKYLNFKKYKLNLKKHIKPIFEMLLPGIIYTFSAMLDKAMIKAISSSSDGVGYYEQAYKIAFVGITAMSVFSTVLSSRISSMENDKDIKELHKYSYAILLVISIPMFIGLYFFSDYFIPFYYGSGYEESIKILKLFSVLPFIMGVSNFISYQYFVPKIITKPSLIIIIISIAINIILNYFLINLYGAYGAALATLISEGFISVAYMIIYLKYQKFNVVFKYTYKYFLSGLIVFFVIFFIKSLIPCNKFIVFVLYVIFILCGFVVVLDLQKDEICEKTINKLIDKIKQKEAK